MTRYLSISPAKIRRAWADQERTIAELAQELGMHPRHLQDRAAAMKLPPRRGGRRPALDDERLRAMWDAGVSIADIAAALGAHYNGIQKAARRLKLKPRVQGRHYRLTIEEFEADQLRLRMAAEAAEARRAMAAFRARVDGTGRRAAA